MEVEDKAIQRLQSLGLTQNQAKVYLSLIWSEKPSTAKTLSFVSKLAVCDVYRVVQQLKQLGLIEELINATKEFRATPPEDAVKILQQRMTEELKEKQKQANAFLEEINLAKNLELPETSKMVLIPNILRAHQFGMPKLRLTSKQLAAIQTNMLFRRFIDDTADDLPELLKKNVNMRFIIESVQGLENPDKSLVKLLKNCNFTVRFAKSKIEACILMHDDTNAFIGTSLDGIRNAPIYWSNNSCLVAVVRNYFETTWRESLERPIRME